MIYSGRRRPLRRRSRHDPDLDGLTEAFVKARYSQEPVAQQEAEAVKPLWQRIKAALRRQRIGREQP